MRNTKKELTNRANLEIIHHPRADFYIDIKETGNGVVPQHHYHHQET